MNRDTPHYEVIKTRFMELCGNKDLLDNPKHVRKMMSYLNDIRLMQLKKSIVEPDSVK